jgi:hypothetical protein
MASGDTLIVFNALANEPPSASYATLAFRNGHPILEFDQTTQEVAIFSGIMPRHYAGGGITVYLHWAAVPTTGTVGWDVAFERIGAAQQDIDADGFAAAETVTAATVDGTSGNVTVTSKDMTTLDSIAPGEAFRVRVRRDVTNDTAAGDAQLLAVELKET